MDEGPRLGGKDRNEHTARNFHWDSHSKRAAVAGSHIREMERYLGRPDAAYGMARRPAQPPLGRRAVMMLISFGAWVVLVGLYIAIVVLAE